MHRSRLWCVFACTLHGIPLLADTTKTRKHLNNLASGINIIKQHVDQEQERVKNLLDNAQSLTEKALNLTCFTDKEKQEEKNATLHDLIDLTTERGPKDTGTLYYISLLLEHGAAAEQPAKKHTNLLHQIWDTRDKLGLAKTTYLIRNLIDNGAKTDITISNTNTPLEAVIIDQIKQAKKTEQNPYYDIIRSHLARTDTGPSRNNPYDLQTSPLQYYAYTGNAGALRDLPRESFTLHAPGEAFIIAASRGKIEAMDTIYERYDKNIPKNKTLEALKHALMKHHVAAAMHLVTYDTPLDLHRIPWAQINKMVTFDFFRKLIVWCLSPDKSTKKDSNPKINYALFVLTQEKKMAQVILKEGEYAQHLATRLGSFPLIRACVAITKQPLLRSRCQEETIFHLAAQGENVELLTQLKDEYPQEYNQIMEDTIKSSEKQ